MKFPKNRLDEKIGPKSPLPYILQVRNWIFGVKKPNLIVRIAFYFMSLLGLVFFFWNSLSFVALQMQSLVHENKNISVTDFLFERAVELEIHPDYILPKLLTYFSVSALCWMAFLFAMVLFWRQKKMYFWIGFGTIAFHIGMAIYYVGGLYFWVEISDLDKVFFFALLVILAFFRFFYFKVEEEAK